jgi:hypothetical protein
MGLISLINPISLIRLITTTKIKGLCNIVPLPLKRLRYSRAIAAGQKIGVE